MSEATPCQDPTRPQGKLTVKIMVETNHSYSQSFITPENELEQIRLQERIERFIRDCIIEFGLEQIGERQL